jgi:hypothetical protein
LRTRPTIRSGRTRSAALRIVSRGRRRERGEARRGQGGSGRGGAGARREDPEPGRADAPQHGHVALPGEVQAQADRRRAEAESLVEARPREVELDEQHPAAVARQRPGEAERDGGRSFARPAAHDAHSAQPLVPSQGPHALGEETAALARGGALVEDRADDRPRPGPGRTFLLEGGHRLEEGYLPLVVVGGRSPAHAFARRSRRS